jgi:LPS-assembly lipoprotein
MSWSRDDRPTIWRRVRRGVLAALLLLPAACGFHPLYGTTTANGVSVDVQRELEAIRIVPSPNRIGQQLYNSLRDKLNPRGVPTEPRYTLIVGLTQNQQEFLLEQDQAATRTYLTITADYHLRRADTRVELLAGTVRTRTGFNLLSNEYASRVAEQDAEFRSAQELADGIRQRLAIFLAEAPAATRAPPKP